MDDTTATAPTTGALTDGDGDRAAEQPQELLEELLVEEISIDGMCGVY